MKYNCVYYFENIVGWIKNEIDITIPFEGHINVQKFFLWNELEL